MLQRELYAALPKLYNPTLQHSGFAGVVGVMLLTRNATPTNWFRCPNQDCGFKFDVLIPSEWGYMAFVVECPRCETLAQRRGTNGMWPRTKAGQAKLRQLIEGMNGRFLPLYRVIKVKGAPVRPPFKLKEVKR